MAAPYQKKEGKISGIIIVLTVPGGFEPPVTEPRSAAFTFLAMGQYGVDDGSNPHRLMKGRSMERRNHRAIQAIDILKGSRESNPNNV